MLNDIPCGPISMPPPGVAMLMPRADMLMFRLLPVVLLPCEGALRAPPRSEVKLMRLEAARIEVLEMPYVVGMLPPRGIIVESGAAIGLWGEGSRGESVSASRAQLRVKRRTGWCEVRCDVMLTWTWTRSPLTMVDEKEL